MFWQAENQLHIATILQVNDAAFLNSGRKDGGYMLNALTALLLCMEQTFTQASAWGKGLPKAFSAALDFYVASGHIRKIHDVITTITLGKRLFVHHTDQYGRKSKHLNEEMVAKINTLMAENRLHRGIALLVRFVPALSTLASVIIAHLGETRDSITDHPFRCLPQCYSLAQYTKAVLSGALTECSPVSLLPPKTQPDLASFATFIHYLLRLLILTLNETHNINRTSLPAQHASSQIPFIPRRQPPSSPTMRQHKSFPVAIALRCFSPSHLRPDSQDLAIPADPNFQQGKWQSPTPNAEAVRAPARVKISADRMCSAYKEEKATGCTTLVHRWGWIAWEEGSSDSTSPSSLVFAPFAVVESFSAAQPSRCCTDAAEQAVIAALDLPGGQSVQAAPCVFFLCIPADHEDRPQTCLAGRRGTRTSLDSLHSVQDLISAMLDEELAAGVQVRQTDLGKLMSTFVGAPFLFTSIQP
ncbi:hypothetical protein FIBSPDRAFT_968639 [Athelia psychrophila]|uniref:Uncharacterized protein n=1 Tax=Athelia psychrophila TaxID=1759441 RepID=A0A167UE02_9AGAM|nr:hypothetical protein FIBSPDRAFT_968639 [Fibularhizoctonia sp. CBS 109695]